MSLHNRIITHKDLHPKTANQKELFHSASSLDWQPMTDHSRGMQSVIQKLELLKIIIFAWHNRKVRSNFLSLLKRNFLSFPKFLSPAPPVVLEFQVERFLTFFETEFASLRRPCGMAHARRILLKPVNNPHKICMPSPRPSGAYFPFLTFILSHMGLRL